MSRSSSVSRGFPATISLLVVDDDPIDCQSIARLISDAGLSCSVTTAHSLGEAREKVAAVGFDVAILAHPLRDGAAFDLLPELRDTPSIILLEAGSERLAVEVLRREPSHCLVKDAGGAYLHLLPAAVNLVLVRRRTQSEFLSEKRYRLLFNAMTEGFALHEIVCDEQGRPCDYRFLEVNPAFERLTGRRRADVVGKLKRQCFPGEDEFWIQTYGAVALGGPPANFEHCSSLSGRHWRVYAYSPAPRQFAALFSDITQRKRAEAALQEAEERFRAFMDNSPAVAWAKDEWRRYVYLSRTYEERFAVRLEDWRSKTDFDVWPRECAERYQKTDDQVLHSGQSMNAVEETQNPDGTWSSWWYFKFLFQDAAGRKYVGGMAVDITERKRAEEELKHAHDVLETRVHERTAELSAANEQLQRDITHRKEAEEKMQRHQAELAHVARLSTLGELATGLAHEINQPLCAITNYAQGCIHRLRSGQFRTDELREALEHVAAEAERAAEIIRRLRNLVLKRGPHRSSVDINELIRSVVQLSAAELRQRQVAVEFHLANDLPLPLADSIQIQQVVLNLIRNGFEALEDSRPPRILTIQSRVERDQAVEVVVHDNGRGLPADDAERIFAPFYTTKPNGLGMGLSISRSIVESHGGRLWASAASRGTEFHFTLPLPAEDESHA